jgi:hypothetical protein
MLGLMGPKTRLWKHALINISIVSQSVAIHSVSCVLEIRHLGWIVGRKQKGYVGSRERPEMEGQSCTWYNRSSNLVSCQR